MEPSISRNVVVRNFTPGQDQPAIVTRAWGPKCINVMVLPDCGTPTCKTSVPFFQSEQEAAEHLAGMPGHQPLVAFWPTRV